MANFDKYISDNKKIGILPPCIIDNSRICEINKEKKSSKDKMGRYGRYKLKQDWDWRLSLKKFDVVDCYDRQRWFPATVCEVIDYENNRNRRWELYNTLSC